MNREDFIKMGTEVLGEMFDNINGVKSVSINEFKEDRTALVIVDMINGFAREGALNSPRVERLIEPIVELMRRCEERGIKKIAFSDCHGEDCLEFGAYPPHCLKGSSESEVVKEIASEGNYYLIPKNSTNGFLEEEFQSWIKANNEIDTFIVTGDCTDICILQFALTLKMYFNMINRKSRVIVPVNGVDTYDLGTHNGDFMNLISLQIMQWNGIEVVKNIELH